MRVAVRVFLAHCAVTVWSILLEVAIFLVRTLTTVIPAFARIHIDKRSVLPPVIAQKTIWLHAASLGEVRVLLRFAEILHTRNPGIVFVATATSDSGVELLCRRAGGAFLWTGYCPVDTLWRMKRFLAACSVTRLWLVETEIWPSMLTACRLSGIPIGIMNARLEEDTARAYRRFSFLFEPLFSAFDLILVQTEAYAQRFVACGADPKRIVETGNIKSNVAITPIERTIRDRLRLSMGLLPDELVVVAGCVHPGEGEILIAACMVVSSVRKMRLIVVPRHPDKSLAIAVELGNVPSISELTFNPADPVVVVGAFGVLEDLYAVADVAVMGGTFVPVGGHNIFEAAACGIPVLTGPDYHTQQKSYDDLIEASIAWVVKDSAMLARKILWAGGEGQTEVAHNIVNYVPPHNILTDALERVN